MSGHAPHDADDHLISLLDSSRVPVQLRPRPWVITFPDVVARCPSCTSTRHGSSSPLISGTHYESPAEPRIQHISAPARGCRRALAEAPEDARRKGGRRRDAGPGTERGVRVPRPQTVSPATDSPTGSLSGHVPSTTAVASPLRRRKLWKSAAHSAYQSI